MRRFTREQIESYLKALDKFLSEEATPTEKFKLPKEK